MHEYPITQRIVEIANRHAEEAGASKVTAVHLVNGDYSGVVGESIEMYFDVIAEGTPCEGAVLTIRRVIPKLQCEKCGNYFERKKFSFTCPDCGGEGFPTEIGKEFYVESIEVESEEESN